ncbi:MAG: prepilin peptidase [Hyphomicrobium sp.]|nr:prepilin peptidase [Hyphomicrobium sp.]
MAFAAATDVLTLTIPNRISLALIVSFFLAAPLAGMSLETMLMHVGAFAFILAVGIVVFSLGWMGGGDAKLMAAGSLWIGFPLLVPFFAYIAICGGALAVVMLLYRRIPAEALPGHDWVARLHRAESGIPYGLAIAGGAMWVYPKTEIFRGLIG